MKKMEGQSIVETALVAPLFLLLLFMIIDVGRITYSLSRLNFVCQETVRLAGLGNGNTQVEEYARSKVDSVAVNISPAEETLRKPGTFVTELWMRDWIISLHLQMLFFLHPFMQKLNQLYGLNRSDKGEKV
jgi:hypothetical protein